MVEKRKIALFFDRTYVDAHHCFRELANQLAGLGFGIDLYSIANSFNHQPFFEDPNIRLFQFPISKFQLLEFWAKVLYAKDRQYCAIVATPIEGTWLAYRVAKIKKIPYYYLADELVKHLLSGKPEKARIRLDRRNYVANKGATATIALGEERFLLQKKFNRIDYPHTYFVIPNSPGGRPVRQKSNFFRDIFDIEDRKPILLFAGTLNWNLAKQIFESTKNYGERDYHIVFHTRTIGLMGEESHPFIKISHVPLPANMMNYAVSSADIGLALYDKFSEHETMNAFTGGKIGTYLKNELPLIAGSARDLKVLEDEKVGVYWDGEVEFDEIAKKAIRNLEMNRAHIDCFFQKHLQYDVFFQPLGEHLLQAIS